MLVGLLWYSGSGQLSHFSPDSKPIDLLKINQKLASIKPIEENLLIHIFESKCRCNLVAEPHIQSVKKLAKAHDFKNLQVNISEQPSWRAIIPSTPAVIAIKDNRIVYVGPYSTGFSCLPGDGLIEPFIIKPSLYPVVKSDGFGCYCNNNI